MAKRKNGGMRGPTGKTGATGQTSARGQRGERGRRGARGLAGPMGPAGPVGPAPDRAAVLAMVEDQFLEIRKELGLQLSRMGQIQAQLDQIHGLVKKLVET